VLGLIGESGAGKSTIGLAAMGFARDGCRISGGEIEFDGIDLRTASETGAPRLRGKRIAYVAQSAAASFNPAHKLIDQHTEAPVQHHVMKPGEAEEDAIDLYRRMRCPTPTRSASAIPTRSRAGSLQRAMTAMAMACRPDLIIFDEPTTALDVTTQIEVLAAIRDIVDQFDTAAIYITHDLAVVAQMADKIKVLLKGEEVEEADTRTMLTNPTQDYTKSLWAVRSFTSPKAARRKRASRRSSRSATSRRLRLGRRAEDISFDIHARRTVAVVGESGSGKSTTARVITGLLPPRRGEVLFNGERPAPRLPQPHPRPAAPGADDLPDGRHRAEPQAQDREIIGRPAQMYLGPQRQGAGDRIKDLSSLIELEPDDYIDRLPSELSGGQKQRIGIARALAAEPQFIICDEVTSALDQLGGRRHPEAARPAAGGIRTSPTCSSPTTSPRCAPSPTRWS
jgi:peptide/nickel transport system ATP-binding protein